MIDTPFLLIPLAMSVITIAIARIRKRKSTALTMLSDDDLAAILTNLPDTDPTARRRITLLVVEELERRRA